MCLYSRSASLLASNPCGKMFQTSFFVSTLVSNAGLKMSTMPLAKRSASLLLSRGAHSPHSSLPLWRKTAKKPFLLDWRRSAKPSGHLVYPCASHPTTPPQNQGTFVPPLLQIVPGRDPAKIGHAMLPAPRPSWLRSKNNFSAMSLFERVEGLISMPGATSS